MKIPPSEQQFSTQLSPDKEEKNYRRQVLEAHFSYVSPKRFQNPKVIHINTKLAQELGFNFDKIDDTNFRDLMTGRIDFQEYKSFSMCYGGHQFGHWAGQLGDGRAITIAELKTAEKTISLQLKGAGETPFSRTADGFAVLRSSIREYLCSHAIKQLGVPTTEALALHLTGEKVHRDPFYDGRVIAEKGAVVCRTSESFVRFGNFEILAARKDLKNLKLLADYCCDFYYKSETQAFEGKAKYLQFFKSVAQRTLDLVVDWQRVGFVHGVMNTDNMSIVGETIDFGPYGWLEAYDPNWTPNLTDAQNKRYRFGNQMNIALWNLVKLANALFPLLNEATGLEAILEESVQEVKAAYFEMMKSKLGLQESKATDEGLIQNLEELLEDFKPDYTLFFRYLSSFSVQDRVEESWENISPAFYDLETLSQAQKDDWMRWFEAYKNRLGEEQGSESERHQAMKLVNPKYVLRNYMAQLAIEAADNADYSVIEDLFELLKSPYAEQKDQEKWFAKQPEWAKTKAACSQLTCSS
ncbi:MAG: protein adenylyltransferase SelO [Flavobacteriales bacterium]